MATFFPLFSGLPGCKGKTTVHNFAPDFLEKEVMSKKYLSVLWLEEKGWQSKGIATLEPLESRVVTSEEVESYIDGISFSILALTDDRLKERLTNLPSKTVPNTVPSWRATVSIKIGKAEASYQGEIKPFPSKANLISFSPLFQSGYENQHKLLFLNLENDPTIREGTIKWAYADEPKKIIGEKSIYSNNLNLIDIENKVITSNRILIFYSKEIAGIPIYISYSSKDNSISMEHSHPPASMTIHGNRGESQYKIKNRWNKILT